MNKQSAKMIDDVGKRDFFIDDASIEKYSKALVAEVLSPSRLIEFVMDHVQPINSDEPQSLIALRTAIDSRYPELRERYQAGDRNNEALLKVIEEQVVYFVGLEVGRRIVRD